MFEKFILNENIHNANKLLEQSEPAVVCKFTKWNHRGMYNYFGLFIIVWAKPDEVSDNNYSCPQSDGCLYLIVQTAMSDVLISGQIIFN